jgi:hypothetical protein
MITYWITTAILATQCVVGGVLGALRLPPFIDIATDLGYPAYFMQSRTSTARRRSTQCRGVPLGFSLRGRREPPSPDHQALSSGTARSVLGWPDRYSSGAAQ